MLRPSPEHSDQKSSDMLGNVRAKRAKARWERWLVEERHMFGWVEKAGREGGKSGLIVDVMSDYVTSRT